MGPFFVSSSFLHFKKHQHFLSTWSLLGRNMPFLYTIKWYSTTRIKLNYTTTSAGCYKDWWLSKEWWQELRVSLETTLYMSTIIKYSKAVITSQLFFCIENLQFSFEKVFNIVDPAIYLPTYVYCIWIYYIRHWRKLFILVHLLSQKNCLFNESHDFTKFQSTIDSIFDRELRFALSLSALLLL